MRAGLLAGLLALVCRLAAALVRFSQILRSLHKVDDYPLYVMRYRGRYPFDSYLKRGIDHPIFRFLDRGAPALPETAAAGLDGAGAGPVSNEPDAGTIGPAGVPIGNRSDGVGPACTCFAALHPGGPILHGRNYDWQRHPALLLFTDPPGGYASVSLNDIYYLGLTGGRISGLQRLKLLLAPYLIVDGMNEHGLSASVMKVPCREGPRDPDKVTLVSNSVMRLALDHARDVEEALALLKGYNVAFPRACVHYLFVDAVGQAAVVEYIDGEMVVIRNQEPWQVATNFLLTEERPEGADSSCWRYNAVHRGLQAAGGRITPEEAMDLAREASVDEERYETVWSAVYNLTAGEVQVAMGRAFDRVHTFRLRMAGEP